MKTYKKTIESPLLEIRNADYYPNQRNLQDNLGYFITIDRNYNSPDDHPDFMEIIKETGDVATSQDDHIKLIKKEIKNRLNEKVIAIYPICKHEHGGVIYRLGTCHGFDYSNNGFYIITEKTQKDLGTPKKFFKEVISQELCDYTQWANGEVYEYILKNESGETIESVTGFYSIDDIKTELGKEWENEDLEEYFTMN